MLKTRMRRAFRLSVITALAAALSACGGDGGGSDLVEESTEKADAACACENFGCTEDYIRWFNEVSIAREDDLSALSPEDYDTYLGNSLRAGDCQETVR